MDRLTAANINSHLRNPLPKTFRQFLTIFHISVQHANQKLLPAEAEYPVIGTQVINDVMGGSGKNLISRYMPTSIIDELEVIQIHHRDTATMDTALNQLLLLAQLRQHVDPVGSAGQWIGISLYILQLP